MAAADEPALQSDHATSEGNDGNARPEPGTADALFLFSFLIPGSFIRGIDWTRLLLCAATFNPVGPALSPFSFSPALAGGELSVRWRLRSRRRAKNSVSS